MHTGLRQFIDDATLDHVQRADLLEVFQAIQALTEDPVRALQLMREEPLRAFGGRTPADLVMQGRTRDVVAYLESFLGGAAG